METGTNSDSLSNRERATNNGRQRSVPTKLEPFVPKRDHNPKELRSWAKRTGFVSTFSSETTTSNDLDSFELERGAGQQQRNIGSSPKIEIDPVLGRTRPNRGIEIEPDSGPEPARLGKGVKYGNGRGLELRDERKKRTIEDEFAVLRTKEEESKVQVQGNGAGRGNGNVKSNGTDNRNVNGNEIPLITPPVDKEEGDDGRDVGIDMYPGGEEPVDGGWHRQTGMKCGLRDNPGFGE